MIDGVSDNCGNSSYQIIVSEDFALKSYCNKNQGGRH